MSDLPDALELDDDLMAVAERMAQESRAFVSTVSELAAGRASEATFPLLLLALADLGASGAMLGAMVDIVPKERFEPDDGPDFDADPLREGLEGVFGPLDEYREVADPLLDAEVTGASLAGDIATIAQSLSQGLVHHDADQISEALWWWQFSYLQVWGDRAASALRVVITLLTHLRMDVDEEIARAAEHEALRVE